VKLQNVIHIADRLLIASLVCGSLGRTAIVVAMILAVPGSVARLPMSTGPAPAPTSVPLTLREEPLPAIPGAIGTAGVNCFAAASQLAARITHTNLSAPSVSGGERGDAHDARAYLRDTSEAARNAGKANSETTTSLWINSPAWVGNTSPPDPVTTIPTATR
jgi:hypothetical protein